MIFIIITINNVMIIITLSPEATGSCNRCFFNVRCPCQPNHRTGTSGTRLPHHHQATWHVPGPGDTCLGTRRMCGAGGDWTGLDWVLLCSVVFGADSSVAGPHRTSGRCVGGTQPPPPPPQLAGPTSNIWRAPASSLHYQACGHAGPVQCPSAPLP